MADVSMVVYHHTGAMDARPTAEQIAEYQTGPTAHAPFPAIAYHAVIDPDGTVFTCHDMETLVWGQGAGSAEAIQGVGSNNWRSIAVCFSGQEPTPEQVEAMGTVADALDTLLHRLVRTIHRHVSRAADGRELTSCPGETWPRWLDEVR